MGRTAYVVDPADREAFKRCRRAWDLGARGREDYERIQPPPAVDAARALRDALAVYYFPGMWEWERSVVQPLAIEAFVTSLGRQGGGSELGDGGLEVLAAYFQWAPTADRFTPVRVETDLSVSIPDPVLPGRDLACADGLPVRYEERIDMVVVDDDDCYWIVEHRFVDGEWDDVELLVLDERGVSSCWAWETSTLGARVAGVIYNEVQAGRQGDRLPAAGQPLPPPERPRFRHRRLDARGEPKPGPRVTQVESGRFRRTHIARSQSEMEVHRRRLAREALDMVDPDVHLYPSPSRRNCTDCQYRPPCVAMEEGTDVEVVLSGAYRRRSHEVEQGRLGGSTWSMNRGAAPPTFRQGDR